MGSRRDGESSPEPPFQNIFQRTLCDVKTTSNVSIALIVGSVILSLPANRQIGVRFPTREVSLISSNFLNTGCGYVSCLKNVSLNFKYFDTIEMAAQRPLSGVILLFILKPQPDTSLSINIGQFHQKSNFQKQRFLWDSSNT